MMSCYRQLAIVNISNSVQELSLYFMECAKCAMKFSSVGHLVNEPKGKIINLYFIVLKVKYLEIQLLQMCLYIP